MTKGKTGGIFKVEREFKQLIIIKNEKKGKKNLKYRRKQKWHKLMTL
ncbi:hypothetical protein HMPREF0554_2473 [Pseudoleptotrichia goodfellowii F0264]|uniref:Uncharacterized protein n=1 Tax=Pseudoleptotrichia goodfellowii F0264 TaxID=596323 RepID=D0GK78_9FUSO|nr:hypothetical protein HMPREF0554_2473 [Pseudoleptotrichia goodfellowii F0264]